MVIAADRRQARVIMSYVRSLLEEVPMLRRIVVASMKESIELSNRVMIEIHTSSFRSVRGYTLAAVICDEIAFWTSRDSANPDREILAALRPGMATIPGAVTRAEAFLGLPRETSRRDDFLTAVPSRVVHLFDPEAMVSDIVRDWLTRPGPFSLLLNVMGNVHRLRVRLKLLDGRYSDLLPIAEAWKLFVARPDTHITDEGVVIRMESYHGCSIYCECARVDCGRG